MSSKKRLNQTNEQTPTTDQVFDQMSIQEDTTKLKIGILLTTSHAVFSDDDKR